VYNLWTLINNVVLHTENLLKKYILCAFTMLGLTMEGDEYVNLFDQSNHLIMHTYIRKWGCSHPTYVYNRTKF
jgi:hypothetical protein